MVAWTTGSPTVDGPAWQVLLLALADNTVKITEPMNNVHVVTFRFFLQRRGSFVFGEVEDQKKKSKWPLTAGGGGRACVCESEVAYTRCRRALPLLHK